MVAIRGEGGSAHYIGNLGYNAHYIHSLKKVGECECWLKYIKKGLVAGNHWADRYILGCGQIAIYRCCDDLHVMGANREVNQLDTHTCTYLTSLLPFLSFLFF